MLSRNHSVNNSVRTVFGSGCASLGSSTMSKMCFLSPIATFTCVRTKLRIFSGWLRVAFHVATKDLKTICYKALVVSSVWFVYRYVVNIEHWKRNPDGYRRLEFHILRFLLVSIFQFCVGGCVVPGYWNWEQRRQKLLRLRPWYLRKSHGLASFTFTKTMLSNHYVK